MKGYIPSSEELTNYELGYNLADDTLSLKVDSGLVNRILKPRARKWVDVKANRVVGNTYVNNNNYEIEVSIVIKSNATFETDAWLIINDTTVSAILNTGTITTRSPISATIPPNAKYLVDTYQNKGEIYSWAELV